MPRKVDKLPLPLKLILVFALIGLAVAVVLLTVAVKFKGGGDTVWVFIILCPPSLGLMALDAAGTWAHAAGLLYVVTANAVLYGGIGFLGWLVYAKVIPPHPD
jgi:hypothetical protein